MLSRPAAKVCLLVLSFLLAVCMWGFLLLLLATADPSWLFPIMCTAFAAIFALLAAEHV